MINVNYTSPRIHGLYCFGCGPLNQSGINTNFSFNEESGEVYFTYRVPKNFQGGPGYVHGGILSSLLDEAQGSMCHYLGYLVMTHHLLLKYHKAAPIEKEFVVRARLKRLNKKRIYTVGSIESEESGLHVSSRASWYILSEKIVHRMFSQQENKRNDDFTVKMVYERLEVYRNKAKQSKALAKLLV